MRRRRFHAVNNALRDEFERVSAGPRLGLRCVTLGAVDAPTHVARVRLASTAPLGEWLCDALEQLRTDRPPRVVVLDATEGGPSDWRLTGAELDAMALFELPLVFAFEGALSRAAVEVALAADIRICDSGGSMQGPLRNTRRVLTLAGEGGALPLVVGQVVRADALLKSGLVSAILPTGGVLAEAVRLAEVIASQGPIATRLAKEAIWRGLPMRLEEGLRFETDLTLLLQTTKDRAEGVRAFLEKRTPNFTGD